MELETIEVKFAVAPEHTDAALAALAVAEDDVEVRSIFFFDTEDLSLFERGIILRMRSSEEKTDATFKVRGDDARGAAERFHDAIDDAETKLEGDQNVGRAVLPSFSITRAVEPDEDVASLFEVLLAELRTAKVKRFGPFLSRTWKKTKIKGLGKVTIELWESARLRLLEISDKKAAGDDAQDFERVLASRMNAMGIAQLPGSKTERALRS